MGEYFHLVLQLRLCTAQLCITVARFYYLHVGTHLWPCSPLQILHGNLRALIARLYVTPGMVGVEGSVYLTV